MFYIVWSSYAPGRASPCAGAVFSRWRMPRYPDTPTQHRGRAKQIKSGDQLQAEPSCCWGGERRRREGGGASTVSSGGEESWWWEHRKGLGGIEGIMAKCWMWDQVMFGQGLRKYHMRHLHVRRFYQGSSLLGHREPSGRDDGTQTQASAGKRHKQTFALVGCRDWHWVTGVAHK